MKGNYRTMCFVYVLFLAIVVEVGCAPVGVTTASATGSEPHKPKIQFKELQSDLGPVYLNTIDRNGTTFFIHGTDQIVVQTMTNNLINKGMTQAPSASTATFIIEIRPGFVGAYKDYPNAPKFTGDLGVVAATATNTGLLASGTSYGKAGAYADLAGSFITLAAKIAEHQNTPNIYVGELSFRIIEQVVTEDKSMRKSKKNHQGPAVQSFEHEGMFRTSASGVGLTANVGLPALSAHMGELVAGVF